MSYAWIGLTYQRVEGKFEWNINHHSKYLNWCSRQPNGGHHCVQIRPSIECWINYSCSDGDYYICEIP